MSDQSEAGQTVAGQPEPEQAQSQQAQPERTVRRYFRAVDAGDTATLLELFTEDAEYERQGTPTLRGKDALRKFYTEDRVIASGRHTLEDVCLGTDWVAVRGTLRGTLRSGEDVEIEFTDWYHLRDGRIDRRQTLFPGRTV